MLVLLESYYCFVFVCTGNPQSVISWTKNEQLILQRGEDAVKVFRSGIVFENLTVTDSGNYKCDVDNEKGHIDFTYEVDVIGKKALTYRINT